MSQPAERQTTKTLYVRGLTADYAVVQSAGVGWLALGAVRAADGPACQPARVLTGSGATPDEALRQLRDQLAEAADSSA
jgi:hypothetical protein